MSASGPSRDSFAFRLFLGVALTLLICGGGAYAIVARQAHDQYVNQRTEELRESLAARKVRGITELRALARELADAPGVRGVEIADARGRVRVRRGETGGDTIASEEALASRAGAYRVVVHHERTEVDAFLAGMRDLMFVLALPVLALALGLFWLLAGRALYARHRTALRTATTDALTGLGDHRAFQEELRRAASLAERNGIDFALAVFDIDDFKFLNDRRGHQQGDEVLVKVGDALRQARAEDRAFRVGGDEFALLMPATDEHHAALGATRLRQLMADGGVKVSCGVSATRPGQRGGATIREEADAALYEAKRRHAEAAVRYSEFQDRLFVVTPEKAQAVRMLLHDRALDVALQPIWDLESGGVVGFEALARPHPDYEFAGPAEAFDVAEQIGRIGELDRLCVSRILERAPQLPEGALLFINVHPANLDDENDGAGWLARAARDAGADPSRIVIEVTERRGARIAAVARSIDQLRRIGFRVALDDVGAGNSGLEMLNATYVDFVKVDRGVVSRAAVDIRARAVLAAITAFAHTSGTYVIAEGIEDSGALDFLRALEVNVSGGIRGGQGYGLGRPAPTVADALAEPRPAMGVVTGPRA